MKFVKNLLLMAGTALTLSAAPLSPVEQRIAATVDANLAASNALVEKLVNINSGTLNLEGVRRIADEIRPRFEALGFNVRWIPMDATHRAGHLVAERKGTHGKRVLLIGHLDTVFDPSSPFQKFEAHGASAVGPGAADMKGGLAIILYSLQALQTAGALDGASITVFLTGDEEKPGAPLSVARGDLIEAARHNDVALEFEPGVVADGRDYASIARRSSSSWQLTATGKSGHSAGIFEPASGDGAIYELARILNAFHDQLREPGLTYNVGLALGGTTVAYNAREHTGTASGKANIIPGQATASGDIRTLTDEQLQRTRERMRRIVAAHLPGTGAEIQFNEGYPAMPATPGNQRLLDLLNGVNRDLGFATFETLPPGRRGAGDLSFAAPYLDALCALGAVGSGTHAPGETLDLSRQPVQMKRTALLLYRLTR